MIRGTAVLLAAAVLFAARPARAESAEDKQAMVVLRLLAYDRQLAARKQRGAVVVGVVRDDRDPVSRGSAAAMASALRAGARAVTVAGKPVSVVEIAAGPLVADRLRDLEVDALFLSTGLDAELSEVTRAARARPCLTFAGVPAYMRSGVAIVLGTDQRLRRITISVDLAAARAQGARLSAELLRVAEVVNR